VRDEEKSMAAVAHVAAFSGYLTGGLGFIVGPLVVWLLKKESSRFVDYHGRSCMNFQLSLLVYSLLAGLLLFALMLGAGLADAPGMLLLMAIPALILLAIVIAQAVLTIVAALKASAGEWYRYPLSIPFLPLPAAEEIPGADPPVLH
jgi:uncharacterized Tic20 family protein